MARIASTVANVWRKTPLPMEAFMLFPEQHVQSADEMIAKARQVVAALGGEDRTVGNDD